MKKLFVLGDSISIAYRRPLKMLTQGVFDFTVNEEEERLAELDLDNPMGVNGGDSARVLKKVSNYLHNDFLKYDVMLLNCGLHDIKRELHSHDCQVPIEAYQQNLRRIIDMLVPLPGKLFWIRTTPVEDKRHNSLSSFCRYEKDVRAYNTIADDLMTKAQIPIIDLHGFTLNLPGELYTDHVHYNESVRIAQASFIAGHIWYQ